MSAQSLYPVLLCCHLLGAFTLVSGSVVAAVGAEVAAVHQDSAGIAALLGLSRLGARFVIVGTIVTAAFGLCLVHVGRWGYTTPWVESAITLLTAVIVIGAFGGHRPKRARLLATELASQGREPTEELRALLSDRTSAILNYLAGTVLLGIIVVMVTKPG